MSEAERALIEAASGMTNRLSCPSCIHSNHNGPKHEKRMVLRCGLAGNRHILYASLEFPESWPSPDWCPRNDELGGEER